MVYVIQISFGTGITLFLLNSSKPIPLFGRISWPTLDDF